MTGQEAIEAVRAYLSQIYPKAPPTIVLREEWASEFAWAWKVRFDTQEYLDTGDIRHLPMSRALYVRKDNAAVQFHPHGPCGEAVGVLPGDRDLSAAPEREF